MQALFRGLLLGLSAVFFAQPILAQTSDPNITPNGVIAEVKVIDAASKQIIVKTDAGSLVTVSVADTTVYKKVQPGQTGLTGATDVTFAQIAEGDRIFARGKPAEDNKSVSARMVIVMSKADIAKKQEEERAEWRRRGLLGVITALNPANKEITISTRSMAGMQPVIIPVTDKVQMRRYAPDSIKFADAKDSKFEELQVGDQLRALGDRTPDGTRFNPERIVTGSFRTVAGTVTAIDPATGEVKINDLQSKQSLTIVVKQDAVLRKFPADMAGMMMGGRGQAGGGGNPPAQGQTATAQTGGAPTQGGPGAGGPRTGGGGIQDMLERLPTIALADVKVGDTIVVSSTKGADASRLTAITLVTGADTLLNLMAARQQQQGGGGAAAGGGAAGGGFQGFQMGIGLP